LSYEVHKSVYSDRQERSRKRPKILRMFWGLLANKPFVVRSTQKRLFRSSGALKKTPKNTSYVLGFDRNKPFVVRSTQKRLFRIAWSAQENAQKYYVCFGVCLRINLLSYEVHKSVYSGCLGVLKQTPKNTTYVLGFARMFSAFPVRLMSV